MNLSVEKMLSAWFPRKDGPICKSPFFRRFRPRIDPESIDSRSRVSHEFRYVYFRVPKAANSTVVASLWFAETGTLVTDLDELQVLRDQRWPHVSMLDRRQLHSLVHSYMKFTFVRDPYTRVLAAYLDKIRRNEWGVADEVNAALGRSLGSTVSLDQFLAYLEAGGLGRNAHWARQVDLIPLPVAALDFVGKVETLDRDLPQAVKRILGKQIAFCSLRPHVTGATRDHPSWSRELRRRAFKVYEEDFAVFNYRKEFGEQ